jgi:hypothetical protein
VIFSRTCSITSTLWYVRDHLAVSGRKLTEIEPGTVPRAVPRACAEQEQQHVRAALSAQVEGRGTW